VAAAAPLGHGPARVAAGRHRPKAIERPPKGGPINPGAKRGNPVTDETPESELARLRAENEALRARTRRGTNLRVSEKGGVSVYGLGRFPVTLYKEQWARLLDMADEIRAFIREHDRELKSKE
jgi:hypothetical protein